MHNKTPPILRKCIKSKMLQLGLEPEKEVAPTRGEASGPFFAWVRSARRGGSVRPGWRL